MKNNYLCADCYFLGRDECDKLPRGFGVTRPAELLGKILLQGGWSRCLACRAAVQGTAVGTNGQCKECKKVLSSKFVKSGGSVCGDCAQHVIAPRTYERCQTQKASREFARGNINNHLHSRDTSSLVFHACAAKGYNTRDNNSYTCRQCERTRGGQLFDAVQLKNFRSRATTLICLACRNENEEQVGVPRYEKLTKRHANRQKK